MSGSTWLPPLRRWALVLCLSVGVLLLKVTRAEADENAGWFPPAHELFVPLLADPRELQYALRDVTAVGHRNLGEAAMGDYFGFYRWALDGGALLQFSGGGGAFGRFDLSSNSSNALHVVDFYANLPLDLRMQRWAIRFMPYHTSSHLGDDYVKATGKNSDKHGWDNLRWLLSWDTTRYFRLYSGYTYTFRAVPSGGRSALQGGMEVYGRWFMRGHARMFWANDLQSWQRVDWDPMFTTQLGIKFVKAPGENRGIALFTEYMTGKMPHGQFYLQSESRWNFGVRFEFS